MDGTSASKDVNFQAVNLAVVAIQKRVNNYGYQPKLDTDGIFGGKTKAGVEWMQGRIGVRADGQVGPTTSKAMWRDLVLWFAGVNGVPGDHLYGFSALESSFDPGAVGYISPADRGLCQINLTYNPSTSVEQAFDPFYSINYTAKRLANARLRYSGKTVDLQVKCSIAQHNAPAWADSWYKTGSPPNDKIAKYVELVLENAAKFK